MKRFIALLLFFAFSGLMPGTVGADYKKTKIAVLDFQLQGEGHRTADMGEIVSEWLITALVKEGRFDVIERRLLKKIMEEQKLAMSGIVDESSATQLGKLLGVKVIISGSVIKFEDMLEVNARIIDVETATIIAAESVTSTTATGLEEVIAQMAEIIIKDFPLEGYVVHRDDNSIVIDLGKLAGVKCGMRFSAFREGNVIKHPKTRQVLDVEKIETGIVEIKKVRKKTAQAEIVEEESPGAIEYGNMVTSISVPLIREKGQLYVNTDPQNARVRILNIGSSYRRGMELEPGRYYVEVSADGYERKKQWVALPAGEDKYLTVYLGKYKPPVSGTKPVRGTKSIDGGPDVTKYVNMLRSDDASKKRAAARAIHKSYSRHPGLLEVVNEELLKGYNMKVRDGHHVDAMAWLCNVLGASGQTDYKATLEKVARETRSRKLKKYARQNSRRLR